MEASLESRLGMKINLDHPTLPWPVKHAAVIVIKYLIKDRRNASYNMVEVGSVLNQ